MRWVGLVRLVIIIIVVFFFLFLALVRFGSSSYHRGSIWFLVHGRPGYFFVDIETLTIVVVVFLVDTRGVRRTIDWFIFLNNRI